jgi:hypothetical protein
MERHPLSHGSSPTWSSATWSPHFDRRAFRSRALDVAEVELPAGERNSSGCLVPVSQSQSCSLQVLVDEQPACFRPTSIDLLRIDSVGTD